MDQAYVVWPDSGCTLASTGHNQNASGSDLTCLLGHDIIITVIKGRQQDVSRHWGNQVGEGKKSEALEF